ncbi:MAG: ABC transporter permease [Spirochaetes bacterium]|nr:ABC transporter permease [Spirochaetota bacterium]
MKRLVGFLLTYSKIILLLAILVVSSSVTQDPLQNIKNMIMVQAPFVLIYSFGMTLAVITGGLDLSLGSVAAFSTCAAAFLLIQGHVALGILVCLLIGAGLGMLNGLLIAKAKVNPFIATYGMDWVIRGAVYIMMSGAMIYHFSHEFKVIADGSVLGISNLVLIAVGILAVLLFVFQKTVFGRNVYMTGANSRVTRLTGVNTDALIIIVYMVSGSLASAAGLLYVARLDCAEAFLGKNFGLQALAATLIGGTSLQGGKGGVGNTVVGVLVIVFLMNCLNVLKVSSLWQDAVFGVVIVVSALLERARQNYVDSLQM